MEVKVKGGTVVGTWEVPKKEEPKSEPKEEKKKKTK